MPPPRNELSNLSQLRLEALGEPGQRTFRVMADGEAGSAVVWLEKEQLFQLSLGIQQLMAATAEREPTLPAPGAGSVTRIPLEFKAGKMSVGHDPRRQMFIIEAHDVEEEDEETASLRLWATRGQASTFAEEGLRVCAAGRPLCPLCAAPMDTGGHVCPKMNGHAPLGGDGT